jgi:lysophospholipase L1-like esterase
VKAAAAKLLTNLGLAAGTVVVLLVVVELGLRASGFSYVLYPEEIEFGKPDPVLLETGFTEDDDLFWVTKDYEEKLARLARERPEILFMGDSCTQFGTYDRELARLVAERRGAALRYGNLAVAGWTSYQGLRQLERDVLPLAPRLVTIYYGWNDHWIGFGIEDENVSRIKRIFSSRWSGLKLVQLGTKALVALGTRRTAYPNRVSLADFSANLRRMVALSVEAGVRPVLITAPTSIREGEEPEYLASRWLRELSELVPLHSSYADAVRAVAADAGAELCDLERRFVELPRPEVEEAFLADGIHFTEEGSRRAASLLFDCLQPHVTR